jgi:hypothetical protein
VNRGFAALSVVLAVPALAPATPRDVVGVGIDAGHVLNTFRPDRSIGAGVDGHGFGEIAQIYTPANLRAMRSAGLGPLTYRLRTELAAEAWHWSASGSFSDGNRGYWTSTSAGAATLTTYGYNLPRRGNTHDQANDSGYSRIDDGNPASFWKSDPYLDAHYTGENHPQWVLIDLRYRQPLNAIRIDWGTPYAVTFQLQRWVGPSAVVQNNHPPGHWTDFPRGAFAGHGGRQTLRLSNRPIDVRFVRVLLTRSSHTGEARDIRDRLGYAVREVQLGRQERRGFVDLVRHRPNNTQTVIYTSSTDPWHRASDRDPNTEQPGFATVLRSGLTRGEPLLVPVSVLYGTPENAVAELRYLMGRHVPLRGVELGEEPDGQLASPEDYGALYVEFARAIHRAFPSLPLGGPGFQTSIPDWYAWPDQHGNRSWVGRFVAYLRGHGALGQLSFFSFEWYPFDNTCAPPGPQLARHAATLANVVNEQLENGLPAVVPRIITEYGYSAFAGRAEVDLPGAMLNAEVVGEFLALGGSTAYLYGYEPDALIEELRNCSTWGNLALLRSDQNHVLHQPLATYWAARMLTQDWLQPGDLPHEMLATTVDSRALGAYAVRRPDGRTSLLLINKDAQRTIDVRTGLGASDVFSFGPAQYVWHPRGPGGYAKPDLAPAQSTVADGHVTLPPFSLAVLRTR